MAKKQKLTSLVSQVKKEKAETQRLKQKQAQKEQGLASRQQHREIRSRIPYVEDDFILLIGEGNFSFASSLANHLHTAERMVATCYDNEDVLKTKYPDAQEHIDTVTELDGKVIYQVDATCIGKTKELKGKRFSKIVFNFPHGNTLFFLPIIHRSSSHCFIH